MATESEIYRNLQKHLDTLPIGFPPTQSGVEIRILKHFFTPEEAKVATCLIITPESIKRIYERVRKTGISLKELKSILDRLERKVCITTSIEGGEKRYRNSLFVVGIWESAVNKVTPELLKMMGQYSQEGFGRELFRVKTPQIRTIPVEKSIPLPEKYQVSTYDSVRELIENNTGQFAVANCICRQAMDLRGQRCKMTDLREVCLLLNGEQYINAGLGRPITREEALEILEKAQDAGLVLQPLNSQRPWAICCCCGDCCGILRNIKQFPRPADYYASNFYAEIDPDLCSGCQTCIERCQLDALFMTNGVAGINLDRCIGCGNCVVSCEVGAVRLKKKEKETVPPKDIDEFHQNVLTKKLSK
jgi:NAD-dependent dihydropyrimidine dehydrogenase PreA subunit